MIGKNGISVFTSHVIAIAVLFVILMAGATSIYSYYNSIRGEAQRSQALAVSQAVADAVLVLYNEYNLSTFEPAEGKNETLSEIYINVPEKISGNSYSLALRRHGEFWIETEVENETYYQDERPYTSVVVDVDGSSSATYEYPIYNTVSANVTGSASKSTTVKISYVREKFSGALRDYIVMERVR